MKIEAIIMVLDNANKLRDECQERLRKYVLDESVLLVERFRVWVAHCDKRNHTTIGINFIRKINAKGIIIVGCNGMTYRDFLVEFDGISINEMKELLIQENFGTLIVCN